MPRLLSAKDKAFQEERQRLMKQTESFRQLVIERDRQLNEKDKEIEALKKQNAELNEWIEKHLDSPSEELIAHIQRTKELSNTLKPLFNSFKMFSPY